MAVVTIPHPWVGGDDATSGNLQTLTDAITLISNPPSARLFMSNGPGTSIPNAAGTIVPFDTEVVDTEPAPGMHNGATFPERLTVLTNGSFRLRARISFAANSTGYRQVGIYKNATLMAYTRYGATPAQVHVQECTTDALACVAGDYFDVRVVQTSGAALALAGTGQFDSEFTAVRFGNF